MDELMSELTRANKFSFAELNEPSLNLESRDFPVKLYFNFNEVFPAAPSLKELI